ncbi:DUF3857 domain-containing protein [Novosphingobium sp. 1949]|uniref:DUF3857 domain-containing protein n=1 Tax=Novosphingobium organovorum TaxID=2930092 RepID=A0ABT0BB71_9SPHN|nr:DUF3857 domain-containing protein [Novosphingobium organovorum]MCJ2182305.1 DUF3857 domain-containing protein [Novosphingobium organovorum]
MRFVSLCLAGVSSLAGAALLAVGPAQAGEDVLYAPPARWVEPYKDKDIDTAGKTPLALYDVQQRIESGVLSIYVDRAIKLDAPQALTQAGTSSAAWQPDKGDLIVHRVQILRGGQVIDVLAGGAKYTVLRRETQLEQRTLDGALTATLAVPGLQMGDVLRIAYTQTIHDPTLKGEVQLTNPLIAAPTEAGFAREIISWPKAEHVVWKTGPGTVAVKESEIAGDHRLTIALPLAKPEDMPEDAPVRYRRPSAIQAGTFRGWAEVSQIFAPLYDPKGTIAEGSALAGEVARIAGQSADPLTRAALATQLVQDQISYQMNGMATGNYVPQTPEQTWQLRYGDCKAKTYLLLALLDALQIAAEPVLVNSSASDAVPDLLPMPNAFDHVLVRATIAGGEYWLDGTSAGTRLANLGDTPGFRNGLPLRRAGAELMAIAPRVPRVPQARVALTFDERGGIDLPTLVTARASLSGAIGANLGAIVAQVSEKQKDEIIEKFAGSTLPNLVITGGSLSYDADSATAHIDVTGIQSGNWERQGVRKREDFGDLPSKDVTFNPDRARALWKDMPVNLGFASNQVTELTVLLPEDEDGYLLRGRPDLDMTFAGNRLQRTATLTDHRLHVVESVESLGGELPAGEIAAEKGKAARIANSAVFLLSPADAVRQWQLGLPEYRARIAPYEEAYAKAIAREPDDADAYLNRASFRWGTTDLAGALKDFDKAIELDPSAATYRRRALLKRVMGNFEAGLLDARKAFELDPSAQSARALAGVLGRTGKTQEALALIDEFDDYGEQHPSFVEVRADVLAYGGRAQDGLDAINALIEERPGQAYLYNSSCWFRARFKVGEDTMIDACNKAVEQSGMASAALDSRALAWLQLGDPGKAKADADAALALAPDQTSTRYFRAIALRRMGDGSGDSYIAYLAKIQPGQVRDFESYGLKP